MGSVRRVCYERPATALAVALFTLAVAACGGGASGGSAAGEAAAEATHTATLAWTRPSLNTDGSPLQDTAGYRVDYGDSPSNLTLSLSVSGASSTGAMVDGLSAGTYYFAVTTLNTAGVASGRSGLVSKTLP